MDEPNPYEPPEASTRSPEAPPTSTSRRDFWGAILGAFLGLVFALLNPMLPAEGLFWKRGGRRGTVPTRLGTAIAIALTIVGPILGGLAGRAIDKRTGGR